MPGLADRQTELAEDVPDVFGHRLLRNHHGSGDLAVAVPLGLGTLVALPSLVGVSIGMTGSPFPTINLPAYLGIIGGTALLGMLSIGIPTRAALRRRPIDPLG